ncbi:MAG: GNAT family N-acetyltransferase [Actinomycetota bacterium]
MSLDTPSLRTDRLELRPWRGEDRAPFAALNADPVVMEHFPSTLSRAESDAFVDRIIDGWTTRGFGLWAVEVVDPPAATEPFIGYVGLWPWDAISPGLVEIGWRLTHRAWGNGYAPEAARAALAFGFDTLGLTEIVSFTVPQNTRSRRVMEKIGMRHDPTRDFDHPGIDPARYPDFVRHVLYRIARPDLRDPEPRPPGLS